MTKWLETVVKDQKRLRLIVACGLALVLILFLWGLFPQEKKTAVQEKEIMLTLEQYQASLEQRVCRMVEQIAGAGKVHVMITLQNGDETIYQSDIRRQKSTGSDSGYEEETEQSVVLVDGENGKRALVQTQRPPAVQGIVIVCDGAENVKVQKRIVDAVKTALAVSSTQVAVVLRDSQQSGR